MVDIQKYIVVSIILFFGVCSLYAKDNIVALIQEKKYREAFDSILSLIQKEVSIIEERPDIVVFFKRQDHPLFYDFVLKETHLLLEKKFYKEALRLYRLLSLYEKNDKELYENYKKAYSFYTNSILEIKKAMAIYQTGDISAAKEKLQNMAKTIPEGSNLAEMVNLGKKEIEKRIEIDYVAPGLKEIERLLAEKNFGEARGYFLMLKRILKPEKIKEVGLKIQIAEKEHYFALGEAARKEKKYQEAIDNIEIYHKNYPQDKEAEDRIALYKEEKLKAEMQVEAYNRLKQGDFYFGQKNYALALFHYKNYLDLVKKDTNIERRIQQLEALLEEEKRRKFFYDNYTKAVDLFKLKDYEKSLRIFEEIVTYPYEKENVNQYIKTAREELEKIRIEREKENMARNYLEEGNRFLANKNYKDALDSYVLALSLANEISGRERLKQDLQDLIKRTQATLKDIEERKLRERLRKIEDNINKGKREYFLGNYEKSLSFFMEVLSLDSENLIAKDYKELIEEAQSVEAIGKISPRDPFYPFFLSLKTEGDHLLKEGLEALKKGREQQAKEFLNESINKWQTIKRAFPYNEEARRNLRTIFRYIDRKGWEESIQEDIKRALDLAEKGENRLAYKILSELHNEVPDYPNLKNYLNRVKPEERRTTLTESERNMAIALYNEALSLFSKKEYTESLKNTEKILAINRYATDDIIEKTKALYIRIKSSIDSANLESLNLTVAQMEERTRYYREAIQFYQKGDFKKAIEMAQRALKIDPTYASAQRLLDAARKRAN